MILWVFIEFFGVKIVITDIYRYFTDIYRYLPIFTNILLIFTDIYRYFTDIFSEIPAQARVLHDCDFSVEKLVFSDFSAKNWRFYRFFPDFSSNRFFLGFFFSMPAENRFFGDISVEKNDFLFPDHYLSNQDKCHN